MSIKLRSNTTERDKLLAYIAYHTQATEGKDYISESMDILWGNAKSSSNKNQSDEQTSIREMLIKKSKRNKEQDLKAFRAVNSFLILCSAIQIKAKGFCTRS